MLQPFEIGIFALRLRLWFLVSALLMLVPGIYAQDPLLMTPDHSPNLPAASCQVCGCSTFPVAPLEWVEVVPKAVVPVAGTVIKSDLSGDDFPFTHPFGWDYDFDLLPDLGGILLAGGNHGLMTSETEQGLLPQNYRPLRRTGWCSTVVGSWTVVIPISTLKFINQPSLQQLE